MTPDTTNTATLHGTAPDATPHFYVYQRDRDYYLGPRHTTWSLPTTGLSVTDAESADLFLLPEDLQRLQIDLGIDAIRQFAEALPYYRAFPERHIFWSSHDDPRSPLPDAIFCKASVNLLEPGRFIAVPYPVEDLGRYCHFDANQLAWQTCFVGYSGSSPLREQLLLAVAANRSLTSQLDIAPKFHSHLDQATRNQRRKRYLDVLAASLTVLCPRGDGMNSIRFFETLSAGRIAVLISDNGLLPFEQLIPYDRFVIRIAEQDVNHTPDLIADWIRQKSDEELMQRCGEARKAWEELLAPERVIYPLQQVVVSQFDHVSGNIFHAKTLRRKEEQQIQGAIAAAYLQKSLSVYDSGDTSEAEQLLRKGMADCPGDPVLIRYLALLLNETGRFEECIALLTQAEQRQPAIPALHRLLGEAYQQTGRWEFASRQFRLALEDEPNNPALLMNAGIVCSRLNHQDEALACLEQAAELKPASASILMNLGCVLQSLNRINEATTTLRTAVRLEPGYATAAWNLAQLLLLQGDFVEGFALFEARFSKRDPVPRLQVATPLWQGENLAGKTVIITTEQAFGDAIQFVRYLPLLARQGARVILYSHLKPLYQLFHSVPGVHIVIEDPSLLPAADYHLPMLSLPRLFETTEATIPNRLIPYLAPGSKKSAIWKDKLKAAVGLKVGVCWAGRQEPDPRRSASLQDLAPLASLTGAVFYSLQLGEVAAEAATTPQGMQLIDLTGEIHDFEDTAALIAQLDLVISVDTSVAHLAGALGKPTFTLLPFAPDWRWLLERQDCPWYPTMRLFRQKTAGDWKHVVNSVLIMITQALPDADGSPSYRHTV